MYLMYLNDFPIICVQKPFVAFFSKNKEMTVATTKASWIALRYDLRL